MRHLEYMKMKAKQAEQQSDHKEIMDMVNHPPHYNKAGIETIDAIMAATNQNKEGYLQGNVIKYIWRYNYKGGLQDLQKAEWYLKKLIEVYKEKHK